MQPDYREKRASDFLNEAALEQHYRRESISPNGYMNLMFGHRGAQVSGGPYRNVPPGVVGVNMAEEIDHPHSIRVPTRDFDVPDMDVFCRGVTEACVAAVLGFPVYIGCMGGIGRTGLFLGGMTKVSLYMGQGVLQRLTGHYPPLEDVVDEVRGQYLGHAIETAEQQAFLKSYDPRPAAKVVRAALKIPLGN